MLPGIRHIAYLDCCCMLVEKIFKEFTIATPFYIMSSPLKYRKVTTYVVHMFGDIIMG